jgi:hypothetical protein
VAQEIEQKGFFNPESWTNVYYAAQIPLEYYLADVLLKSDLTRVQWSSDAYAFRRRFELADATNGGDYTSIGPSSLDLPFVNYWYENGKFWEPDDRPFSVNSQQILKGQWFPGMPARLYAIAVKTPMVGTVYYSTDQDARMAYERLLWERQPKGPIQLSTSVKWKGVDLQIPVFITIESVNFNPKFTEVDWLKTQRMFPMQFSLTLRTYAIYYPIQNSSANLSPDRPMPPYSTGTRSEGPEGNDQVYITESVLLNFASKKQWGDLDDSEGFVVINTVQNSEPGSSTDLVDSNGNKIQYETQTINNAVVDIATGYFSASTDVYINECSIDPNSITIDSFTVSWNIRKTELANLADVTIYIPGQSSIRITDPKIQSQVISGLYPHSEYGIIVLFHSYNGNAKDFHLTAITADDPANPSPLKNRRGRLKGMSW